MTESTDEQDLWPSPAYYRQLEQLRGAVGQVVYLVEINMTAINAGVKISDAPRTLLAVIDFPQPDPYKQLCPHMLILDDGRGINLGHVARISIQQAFAPEPAHVLYQNQAFVDEVLFAPRRLSRALVAQTSRVLLAEMFGDEPGKLLESTN